MEESITTPPGPVWLLAIVNGRGGHNYMLVSERITERVLIWHSYLFMTTTLQKPLIDPISKLYYPSMINLVVVDHTHFLRSDETLQPSHEC